MIGIENTSHSGLISKKLSALGINSTGEKSYWSSGTILVNLTFDDLVSLSEIRERAKLKSEDGERWTKNPLYKVDLDSPKGYTLINKDAINKVRDQLMEDGIDPSKRTPTHEITDEQMAQLMEKYDFEYLLFAGISDPEYGNFLLDLAYMNVFSLDEMEDMFGVLQFNSNNQANLYITHSADSKPYYSVGGNHLYSWEDVIKYLTMEFLKIKYPDLTENDYVEMTEDLLAQTDERMKVVNDFYGRAYSYYANGFTDTITPKIADATEKVKEDFGGRL